MVMKDKRDIDFRSGGFLGGEENDWNMQERNSQQENELRALGANHYIF